jgi:excisionase family DNA binding protein
MFRHEQDICMERLLTTKDLADVTGLAVQTIYNRHSNGGSLPACMNLGGRLRFRQRDVDAWLDSQYEKHQSQPAALGCVELPPRRPGRPTKAEQVARRTGKATSNLRTLN